MDTYVVSFHFEYFKTNFGENIEDADDLFETQRKLFEYLVGLGAVGEQDV